MNNKKDIFGAFLRKAEERLEEKRKTKKRILHIPSLDTNITIRSLNNAEIMECLDFEDSLEGDKYTAYIGIVEPDLKEVASELKRKGEIFNYTDVIDIFRANERTAIVQEILELSEVIGGESVTVVENIKN